VTPESANEVSERLIFNKQGKLINDSINCKEKLFIFKGLLEISIDDNEWLSLL